MQNSKIKSLLLMVGADTSDSTVTMIDGLLSDVPAQYLKHFTEYVLKNYDKHKKPIVNITSVSQEYKKRLKLIQIQRGEFRLKTVEETKAFLLEFFKGQEICNCVEGLYLPFTVIELNEKDEFINKYSFSKLNSEDVSDFIYWCFLNQERIGDIKLIPSITVQALMLENNKRLEQLELELKQGALEAPKSTNDTLDNQRLTSTLKTALNH